MDLYAPWMQYFNHRAGVVDVSSTQPMGRLTQKGVGCTENVLLLLTHETRRTADT
jgi:hypothetical protein